RTATKAARGTTTAFSREGRNMMNLQVRGCSKGQFLAARTRRLVAQARLPKSRKTSEVSLRVRIDGAFEVEVELSGDACEGARHHGAAAGAGQAAGTSDGLEIGFKSEGEDGVAGEEDLAGVRQRQRVATGCRPRGLAGEG